MFRLTRLARSAAGSCHYKTLGVSPTASGEEISRAFRDKAKRMHPDTAKGSGASKEAFRDLVDAYRILRDPKKRKVYDHKAAHQAEATDWPYGEAQNMSEEFRDNLYGRHKPTSRTYQTGGRPFSPGGARADVGLNTAEDYGQLVAISCAVFGAMCFVATLRQPPPGGIYRDRDPYPSRLPGTKPTAKAVGGSAAATSAEGQVPLEQVSAVVNNAPLKRSSSGVSSTSAADAAAAAPPDPVGDELVRAYFNPYMEKWHRIPPGYDAPSSTDLTAWHKKRTDPLAWNRLHATGKLSEIQPRGGLQVRYVPRWEAFEPILVRDPHTSRTIQVSKNMPQRDEKPTCSVQF